MKSALAQAVLDTIDEPLMVLDRRLRVVAANRSFLMTFKMNRQDVQGRPIYALGEGHWDVSELRLLLNRVLSQRTVMEDYEANFLCTTIGPRTLMLSARPMFSAESAPPLILLSVEDVTERQANEHLRDKLLAQKDILLQETRHRVLNSLQFIAGILRLKARSAQTDEARLYLQDAYRRVMSVASVQKQLQHSADGEHIHMEPYLAQLCETLEASIVEGDRHIRVEVHADALDISSAEAVCIGSIVAELMINALKHAFVPPCNSGLIVVSYHAAKGCWRVTVSDDGVGATRPLPGLGSSIIEGLAGQLDARIGISCTVPHGMTVSIVHGDCPARLHDATHCSCAGAAASASHH